METNDTDSRLAKFWKKHRKQRRVRLKRRRARQRIPRPQRTASELVEYLKERGIRTTGELIRKRDADGPTLPDYIKVFSRWKEAVRQAFGDPPPKIQFPVSRQHIIDMVVQLDIQTREQYMSKRRELPQLVASIHQIRKFFPTFSTLMDEAENRSAEMALGKYLALWQKHGKRPDAIHCQRWQVNLEPLNRMFGGKRELDTFLNMIDKPADQNWLRKKVSTTFGRQSKPPKAGAPQLITPVQSAAQPAGAQGDVTGKNELPAY